MPCDERLVERIRKLVAHRRGVTEKKMFGGVCFMVNGNMACGVAKEDLVLRLGEDGSADALQQKHARPMDFTGKPMKSMVYVAPAGIRTEASLRRWVERGIGFARTLPAK